MAKMRSEEEIRQGIRDTIARELNLEPSSVTGASRLRDIIASSVKMLRIIARIEREFDIEIVDDAMFGVHTVSDLSDAVMVAVGAKDS